MARTHEKEIRHERIGQGSSHRRQSRISGRRRGRPTPTPAPGTLSLSPTSIKLAQSATGGPYTGTFTIAAVGGPVSYSISVPSAEQAYLSLSPLTGTLKAGAAQVITATMDGQAPCYANLVNVDPGGITVTLLYPPSG